MSLPPAEGSVLAAVDHTIAHVREDRTLSRDVHGAWQVLHGVLAYGKDFPVETPGGARPALSYLMEGGELVGWTLTKGDRLPNGRDGLRAELEPGGYLGQGHADQWLAILAQAEVKLDDDIVVGEEKYSVGDFLAQVQYDVPYNYDAEWSWTLIGLTQFLPTTTKWKAKDGDTWSVERLVMKELEQEIVSSTCGGTHRLIGLSMALNRRRSERASLTAPWKRAEELLQEAVMTAREFQNGDGTFSTNYFSRPGISADNAKLLATTGHTLELLALTLPPQELRSPWVERAVRRLCQLLDDSRQLPLECGALYHAVHGLIVYRQRVGAS